MNKLTLGKARPRIGNILHVCPTDSRVVDYINEATERLMDLGKWVGTYGRYVVCMTDGCITWPRQILTIEGIAICNQPLDIRNDWYEFSGYGPGLLSDCGCMDMMVDRGEACAFNDITGTVSKIKVYADLPEEAGAKILLRGYDENGQWIQSSDGSGGYIDGEYVTIQNTSPVLSTHFFSSLTQVIKPVTHGPVRLYQYSTVTSSNVQALAVYEPDEELPNYRRSFIPNLANNLVGQTTCQTQKVTVMAKFAFIPVVNDNDFIMIPNLSAIALMVQAIMKEERDLLAEANQYAMRALSRLQDQLNNYLGDGAQVTPQITGGGAQFGSEAIINLR